MKKEVKQIIVIGLGKFGMSIVKTLSKYDCEIMAVDESSDLVDEAAEYITHVARVNALDKEALNEIGIRNFDIAVIGIGNNFEASTMLALMLKEFEVPYIIAKARDENHTKFLKMLGVNQVVEPEKEIGIKIAKNIVHDNIIDSMDLGKEYSIIQINAPDEWIEKKIGELNIRQKYNANLICIEKPNENIKVLPVAEYIIREEDKIMLITPNKELIAGGTLIELI